MRVHIGCGSVYLFDWLNVDIPSPTTFLAKDRPDLVTQWGTTEDKYYAKHQDKTQEALRKGPLVQDYVCDEFGSFADLPGSTWQTDEVLARHSFEHLSITEAHKALDEIDRKMKPGGLLRLDVPDHEQTLQKFKETGDEFYIRHLLGPRRNDFGFHMMSYSKDRLKKLVEGHGFVYEREEENIHFYPAFCLRFKKPGPRLARDYALEGIAIPDDWIVGELGPGRYPWARANAYIDISQNHLNDIKETLGSKAEEKRFYNLDIEKGNPPFPDKYFDFLFCSHVFEHLIDPLKAAQTLGKIAKRGTLVMPSAFKEFMFLWEESDHKWWALPPVEGHLAIRLLQKHKAYADSVYSEDMSKALCRLFRTGPNGLGEDQRILRRWFYEKEPNLDVIHHWEGEPRLRIVE